MHVYNLNLEIVNKVVYIVSMHDVIAVVTPKCSYIVSIKIRKTHITFLPQTYSHPLKCHITGASFAIRLER